MKKGLLLSILMLLFFSDQASIAAKEERKWNDEAVYYIHIDRFNNSDFSNDYGVDANDPNKYHGGDIQGIIDRLDYIQDMGFTSIALSPIFKTAGTHHYGDPIENYRQVNDNFGNLKKFKELVKATHDRKMKIILDFPVVDSGQQEKIINDGKWWIEESEIDGYILKNVNELSSQFIQQFAAVMKKQKEHFLIVLDSGGEDVTSIDGIDATLNYEKSKEMREAYFKPDTPAKIDIEGNFEDTDYSINFLDNSTTSRFTRDSVEMNEHPGPRWKMALTYMFGSPGIPFVMYGSEIALDGGQAPDNLRQMDFRTDKDLIDYVTKIANLRKELPSLRRGDYELLHEQNGFLLFKREYQGEMSVVAINNSTESKSYTLQVKSEEGKELRGLLNGDLVRSKNGEYPIILDRDQAEIYVLAEKSGINVPVVSATAVVVISFIGFLFLLIKRSRRSD